MKLPSWEEKDVKGIHLFTPNCLSYQTASEKTRSFCSIPSQEALIYIRNTYKKAECKIDGIHAKGKKSKKGRNAAMVKN